MSAPPQAPRGPAAVHQPAWLFRKLPRFRSDHPPVMRSRCETTPGAQRELCARDRTGGTQVPGGRGAGRRPRACKALSPAQRRPRWPHARSPVALSPSALGLRPPVPLNAQPPLQTCPGSPAGGQHNKFCFVSKHMRGSPSPAGPAGSGLPAALGALSSPRPGVRSSELQVGQGPHEACRPLLSRVRGLQGRGCRTAVPLKFKEPSPRDSVRAAPGHSRPAHWARPSRTGRPTRSWADGQAGAHVPRSTRSRAAEVPGAELPCRSLRRAPSRDPPGLGKSDLTWPALCRQGPRPDGLGRAPCKQAFGPSPLGPQGAP